MKKFSIIFVVATFMFAGLAGPVMAADDTRTMDKSRTGAAADDTRTMDKPSRTGAAMDQDKAFQSAGMHRASELMDKKVVSQQGEELGSVSDIIIDDQGQVQYVILSKGGILGMGGDSIPVPWDAANLQMGKDEDQLVSNLDKQKIDNAPTLKGDQWSQFAEPGYEQELRSYYGTQRQEGFQQDKDTFQTTPESKTPGMDSETKGFERETKTAPAPAQ